MTTIGGFRPSQQGSETKTFHIKLKGSILNADFFLRYLHRDAKASSYVVKRLGIEKDKSLIALMTESLDTTLEHYIERHPQGLTLEKTGSITREIAKALDFLDESDVVYVNLTPNHIFLSSDGKTVKLAHFEQAYFNEKAHFPLNPLIETSYQSPETLLGIEFSPASNIWALGLIVNKMFTRTFFKSEIKKQIIAFHQYLLWKVYPNYLVKKSHYAEDVYKNSLTINTGLKETLEKTIRRVSNLKQEDPEKTEEFLSLLLEMFKYTDRPNAKEILQHPFFKHFTSEETEIAPSQEEKKLDLSRMSWIKELGNGAFGQVWEMIAKDKTYAVKISKKNSRAKESLLHEDRILRFLQKNPAAKDYIVERFRILKPDDNLIGIVLEKMNCNLSQYIQEQKESLTPEKIQRFARQILKGLQVLFDADIIHLDLKPRNILVSLDGESLKIADFGSSCFTDKACHPNSSCQESRSWRAPEVILEIPFTPASDMWSFGAIMVEMVTSKTPFEVKSEEELIKIHQLRLKRFYPKELLEKASETGLAKFTKKVSLIDSIETITQMIQRSSIEQTSPSLDFIMGALEFDPNKRKTPSALLNHPFLEEEKEDDPDQTDNSIWVMD